MRYVVKTDEVPHLWAHQTQDSARNYGNLSFRGLDLYSYSTRIAFLIPEKKIAVISRRTFSNTTLGHINMAHRALGGDWTVITANAQSESRPDDVAKELINYVETQLLPNLKRKRGNNLIRLLQDIEEHESWIRSLNPKRRPDFVKPEDEASFTFSAGIQQDGINRGVATRQANGVIPFGRSRRRYNYEPTITEDKLPAWLAGEVVNGRFYRLESDFMRLKPDHPEETETTKGAVVPTEHIRKVAPLVVDMILHGKTYKRNGHTIHLGHYTLDEITAEGTVIAGCHKFLKDEVLRFAKILGVETSLAVLNTPKIPGLDVKV